MHSAIPTLVDAGGVLVVDDSPTIRAVVEELLTKLGFPSESLRFAASAAEGVALAREVPALALVDMELGSEEGERVMEAIHERQPTARVVLMTGLPREDPRVRRAISAGAFAFLPKPVRTDAIVAVLDLLAEEQHGYSRIT